MDRASADPDRVVEFRGSLRRGENVFFSLCFIWPRGKLRASREQLVFDATLSLQRTILLPRESVRRIHPAGRFGRALRFEHSVRTQPEYIVFGTWDLENLREGLRGLEYPLG